MQQNFKPKYLFENPEKKSKLRDLEKIYDGNHAFLKVREELVNACSACKKSERSPILTMLQGCKADEIKKIFQEPVTFLEQIIKQTEKVISEPGELATAQ